MADRNAVYGVFGDNSPESPVARWSPPAVSDEDEEAAGDSPQEQHQQDADMWCYLAPGSPDDGVERFVLADSPGGGVESERPVARVVHARPRVVPSSPPRSNRAETPEVHHHWGEGQQQPSRPRSRLSVSSLASSGLASVGSRAGSSIWSGGTPSPRRSASCASMTPRFGSGSSIYKVSDLPDASDLRGDVNLKLSRYEHEKGPLRESVHLRSHVRRFSEPPRDQPHAPVRTKTLQQLEDENRKKKWEVHQRQEALRRRNSSASVSARQRDGVEPVGRLLKRSESVDAVVYKGLPPSDFDRKRSNPAESPVFRGTPRFKDARPDENGRAPLPPLMRRDSLGALSIGSGASGGVPKPSAALVSSTPRFATPQGNDALELEGRGRAVPLSVRELEDRKRQDQWDQARARSQLRRLDFEQERQRRASLEIERRDAAPSSPLRDLPVWASPDSSGPMSKSASPRFTFQQNTRCGAGGALDDPNFSVHLKRSKSLDSQRASAVMQSGPRFHKTPAQPPLARTERPPPSVADAEAAQQQRRLELMRIRAQLAAHSSKYARDAWLGCPSNQEGRAGQQQPHHGPQDLEQRVQARDLERPSAGFASRLPRLPNAPGQSTPGPGAFFRFPEPRADAKKSPGLMSGARFVGGKDADGPRGQVLRSQMDVEDEQRKRQWDHLQHVQALIRAHLFAKKARDQDKQDDKHRERPASAFSPPASEFGSSPRGLDLARATGRPEQKPNLSSRLGPGTFRTQLSMEVKGKPTVPRTPRFVEPKRQGAEPALPSKAELEEEQKRKVLEKIRLQQRQQHFDSYATDLGRDQWMWR